MSEVLTLIESYSGLNSFPYTFNAIPTGNEFIIAAANNNAQKQHWIRAGYIQAVAIVNNVELTGKPEFVAFGRQKISLQIPSVPYKIKFNPSSYVEDWTVDLYQIESSLDYSELSNATGLSEAFLKSQSVTSIQLLLGMSQMASSETRNLGIEVSSIKDSVTGLTSRIDTQESATLGHETIQIDSFDFVSIAGDRHLCTKTMTEVKGGQGLQLILQDTDGDYQGLAQLISGVGGIEQNVGVELSAQQFADTDYPLYLVCQGAKLPVAAVSSGTALSNGSSVLLVNYVMTIKDSSDTVIKTLTDVYQGWYTAGIIYVQYVNGTFTKLSVPYTVETPSDINEWDSANGGIVL